MKDRVINDSVNRITQGYGNGHRGIDLGWRSEEWQNEVHPNCAGTVYATLDGVGPGSEYGGGWGNYVLIRHDNGMFSRYAHLQSGLRVSEGQRVDENTVIGIIGESGRAYGRHLHFEVQMNSSSDSRIDPTRYLTDPICGGSPSGNDVNVYYRVRTQANGWLPEVRNLDDYAGWNDSPITGVAMKVDKGRIEYQVHTIDGRWLSTVDGYNIDDYLNGYAGDGNVIDAIKIYYYTPDDIRPYKYAKYKVNGYDWQIDTQTGNGMDGYAGSFGYSMKKLWITIE
jgi:hypothetical protein